MPSEKFKVDEPHESGGEKKAWQWLAKIAPGEEREAHEYQSMIGQRYDELLAEREKLHKELEKFEIRDYGAIYNPEFLDDRGFEKITAAWLQRAETETRFFQPLQDLGIKIFTNDLERQPNFPDEKITFASKEIRRQKIVNLIEEGGHAKIFEPIIELMDPKPPLRDQVNVFLKKGVLHSTVSILVHELIHRYHFKRSPNYVDGVLTEAQAYFSGIFQTGPHFSLTKIARTLTTPEEESGGLYEYDAGQVVEALKAVATLYGLGMSYDEVSNLIVKSHYDYGKKRFSPLMDVVEKKLKQFHLDEIDSQALDDLYRLYVNNQRLRAQALFFEIIADRFSLQDLRAAYIQMLRQQITFPTYYNAKGRPEYPQKSLVQKAIIPGDDTFPYDPQGKRTGIIFGNFQNQNDAVPTFGLGRWEADASTSAVTLAQTPQETKRYLEALRKQAKDIKLEFKESLLLEYENYQMLPNPQAEKVLDALITPEEAKKILHSQAPNLTDDLTQMLEGLEKAALTNKKHAKKIQAYKQNLESKKRFLAIFKLNIAEEEPTLAEMMNNLEKKISSLETETKH